ncbi:hypothetical protein [Kribbella sp. NPDC051718]|uniref:hypothetical protein n=1 Tax=Kribbella sp. NPDC051718 TaxID=3155168 RepID=UPI00341C7983
MRNALVLCGPPASSKLVAHALSDTDSRFVQFRRLDAIDRPSLVEQLAHGVIPIVQLDEAERVRVLLSAGLPVTWLAVCLWGAGEVDLRGAEPELFDLSLNTVGLSPDVVAALVVQTAGLEQLPSLSAGVVSRRARRLFGRPRFIGYLQHCGGNEPAALEFYRWNSTTSAAMWELLGYLEIALRNALAARMSDRHRRKRRQGSWLDDPLNELDANSRADIRKARERVVRKSKPASDGQTIAELGFGFWRYLLARRYSSNLWPDLAGAFPNAPDRARETVELPVIQIHHLRNRLAHHERIWTVPLRELHAEMLVLLAYMDEDLRSWVADQSRVIELLRSCPQPLPNP